MLEGTGLEGKDELNIKARKLSIHGEGIRLGK